MNHMLFLLVTIINIISIYSQSPFTFTSTCTATKKFDIAALECQSCGTNQVLDTNGQDCRCGPGYIKVLTTSDPSGKTFTCTSCLTLGMAATRDGLTCLFCDTANNATLDASSALDCICPTNYMLSEYELNGSLRTNKTCIACGTNTRNFPSISRYTCLSCSNSLQTLDANGNCVCSSGLITAGSTCVTSTQQDALSPYSVIVAKSITYKDLTISDADATIYSKTVADSYYFSQYYLASAVYCQNGLDEPSCQALANLCVFQKYDTSTAACAIFKQIQSAKSSSLGISHGFSDWSVSMPWLYYADASILTSTLILMSVGLKTSSTTVSTMTYYLAKYYLNGTYIGVEKLGSQLQLCPTDPNTNTLYLDFGTTYTASCYLSLSTLVANYNETIFYEMYIYDQSDTVNTKLYPVPVKLLNYRSGSTTSNLVGGLENMDPATIKLTRRFFLVDSASSKSTLAGNPAILVYAKSIILRVTLQAGVSSKIYPPLLVIQYGEREISYIQSTGDSAKISFVMTYTMDLSTFWNSVVISFSVANVLFFFYWLVKFYTTFRRLQLERFDCSALNRGLFIALGIISDLFFVFLFLLSGYFFLFFKLQSTVFFLLPDAEGEYSLFFKSLVIFTFVAKGIDVFMQLMKHASVDLFIVDWEVPRNPVNESEDNKEKIATPSSSVSVWRRLFITNEWNALQCDQSINMELTLFLLLFFLRGLNLEYLATSQPSISNLASNAAPIHPVLRFAVNTFFWIVCCYIQIFFKDYIYRRFVLDPCAGFVDLVSTANLSLFILDEPYHGYYIHGRTVHEFADVSMEDMREQTRKEQLSLVKPRGLYDGKDTFEIFLARDFRSRYDDIFTNRLTADLKQRQQRRADNRASTSAAPLSANNSSSEALLSMPDSTVVNASNRLNSYLSDFIENKGKFTWQPSTRSYVERLVELPPLVEEVGPAFFYEDEDFEFKNVLMVGIERDWFIVSALYFAILDYMFSNTFVSVLVTYLTNLLVIALRGYFAKINIAAKSLVDEKFLL